MEDNIFNNHLSDLIKQQTKEALKAATKIKEFSTKFGRVGHYKIDDADILTVNDVAQSIIDVDCPQIVHMEYIEEIAKQIDAFFNNNCPPKKVIHLGVGGGTLARHLYYKNPQISQIGVDIDDEMIQYVRNNLKLPSSKHFKIRISLAENEINNFQNESASVIIRDLFQSSEPPALTQTPQFLNQCLNILDNHGVYIANILDDAFYPEIVDHEKTIAKNLIKELNNQNNELNKYNFTKPVIKKIGKKFHKGDFTNYLLIISKIPII